MAFTFSTTGTAVATGYRVEDPVTGMETLSATTNTSSAAGTFYSGFKPRVIEVYDETNSSVFQYFDGMTAGTAFKTTSNGTMTVLLTNGITIAADTTGTVGNGPFGVTLGTGLHTNSSTYRIVSHK